MHRAIANDLDNRDLVASIAYGNGTMIEYAYDNADRLTRVKHSLSAGSPFLQLDYTYDARGLITQIDESEWDGGPPIVTTTTYTYDARRRLTHETRTGGGPVEFAYEYTYDAGGNRTTKKRDRDLDGAWDVTTNYFYDVDPGGS